LFLPFEGDVSFAQLKTDADVVAFFDTYFPDARPMMPTLIDDFFNNPTASLVTTRIHPWHYQDKSALIGDAAHAIVPFYGQGMNAGFEDCTVLNTLMDTYADDWDTILKEYQQLRKPNGDAVADLALHNFVEMRDKVADPRFLERKKIEKELGLNYPKQFVSVYEMVSFSHIPYATALQCIKEQDILLEDILNNRGIFLSDAHADKLGERLNEYHAAVKELDFGNEG
jgi:kynurenine 3-monooxygenase